MQWVWAFDCAINNSKWNKWIRQSRHSPFHDLFLSFSCKNRQKQHRQWNGYSALCVVLCFVTFEHDGFSAFSLRLLFVAFSIGYEFKDNWRTTIWFASASLATDLLIAILPSICFWFTSIVMRVSSWDRRCLPHRLNQWFRWQRSNWFHFHPSQNRLIAPTFLPLRIQVKVKTEIEINWFCHS